MDELHKIARAYYTTADEESKLQGKRFFNSIDHDGNRGITIQEYLAYMKRNGHTKMANRPFFGYLNESRTGELEFMEVMTLFYIIKSGRKFCDGCDVLLKGTFFSCTDCFADDDESFNLCSECLTESKYVHPHRQFLDNYIILENMKKVIAAEKEEQMNNQVQNAGASNAIVLNNQSRLTVFATLLQSVVAAATTLSNCTIM
ncbi:hypothetical protein POTOM_018079 [Populus tomentosa]|uniref:EF-hand domain-containing protein n=1 Tax=Populus tomentosa TaxID=118781 RepID=A0A8X8ABX5_POPTO|nr:hypothetical protein POTOM_018079 [Populus tomentosa]